MRLAIPMTSPAMTQSRILVGTLSTMGDRFYLSRSLTLSSTIHPLLSSALRATGSQVPEIQSSLPLISGIFSMASET